MSSMNQFPALQIRLYSKNGERLYLNKSEREKFKATALNRPLFVSSICLFIFYTGCRPSEAINLRVRDIQWQDGVVAIRSLKKRTQQDPREIPIPEELIESLRSQAQSLLHNEARFWPVDRTTVWRWIKSIMNEANITGPMATTKGLRHSFCVNALSSGVLMHLVQGWMGHSSLAVTVQYARIMGMEERAMAQKMWD